MVRDSNALHALLLPLSPIIWLSTFFSVICLFSVLEALIFAGRTSNYPPISKAFGKPPLPPVLKILMYIQHSGIKTVTALLSPALDQGSSVGKETEEQWVVRMLMSLWLAVLIVLGSAYKSKVIELVVLPVYEQPPGTFEELADSPYGIYTISFYDHLQGDFETLGKQYSREIARRLQITHENGVGYTTLPPQAFSLLSGQL